MVGGMLCKSDKPSIIIIIIIVVEILAPPLPGTLLATWSTLVIEDLL